LTPDPANPRINETLETRSSLTPNTDAAGRGLPGPTGAQRGVRSARFHGADVTGRRAVDRRDGGSL
jgi:hypothetical protein